MNNELVYNGEIIETSIEPVDNGYIAKLDDKTMKLIRMGDGKFRVETDSRKFVACCAIKDDRAYIDIDGTLLELTIPSDDSVSAAGAGGVVGEKDKIFAPMPGKVVKVLVKVGEQVEEGQHLVIVEAMKMENPIPSPSNGVVKKINFFDGDQVGTEEPIIELDIEGDDTEKS